MGWCRDGWCGLIGGLLLLYNMTSVLMVFEC